MRITKNNYRKRLSIIAVAFLFLFSLLYSGTSHVYAKEYDSSVNIEVQTKLMVSDGTNKGQMPTIPFSFELKSEDPNAPLPQTKQVSINGEGKSGFSIIFDKEGTYKYQIHQVTKAEKGWTLDARVYDVTVYVKNDGQGKLIAYFVGIDHDSDKKVDTFTFENRYTKNSETPKPNTPENPSKPDYKKPGSMPKTGDATNITVYAGLGILSASLLLFIYKRKREEKKNKKYEH